MPVYFIQAGEGGAVKVGYSKDPQRRRCDLQTGHASRLTIRALYDGSAADEERLHYRFRHYRLDGEWFSPAVLDEAVDLPRLPDPEQPIPGRRLSREGYRRGGALNTLRASFSHIESILARAAGDGWLRPSQRRDLALRLGKIEAAYRDFPDIAERVLKESTGRNVRRALAHWHARARELAP